MGFESWFKKKPVEKTAEQEKMENQNTAAMSAALVGAAALGGVAVEAAHEPQLPMQDLSSMPIEAPSAKHVLTGMNSTDAPPAIVVPAPAMEQPLLDPEKMPEFEQHMVAEPEH